MKKTLQVCFLVIGLGIMNTAQAQIGMGSIVVIRFSREKVVVAADSREHVTTNHGDIPPHDLKCKIAAFNGKTVFASVGASVYHSKLISWTNTEIVREVLAENGSSTIDQIAKLWADRIANNLRLARTSDSKTIDPAIAKTNGLVTSGFFAQRENGTVDTAVANVTLQNGTTETYPSLLSPCKGGFCAMGQTGTFEEILNLQTPRAESEVESWDNNHLSESSVVTRLIELTGQDDPQDVGGPVGCCGTMG